MVSTSKIPNHPQLARAGRTSDVISVRLEFSPENGD